MKVFRGFVFAASLFLAVGCTKPVGENKKPVKPDDNQKVSAIEKAAYDACQQRDLLAGKRLKQLAADIKSGKYPYDGPLLDQIKKINTEETVKAFDGVEKQLRDSFDPKLEKLNPEKVAAAVESYGNGRERAGSEK